MKYMTVICLLFLVTGPLAAAPNSDSIFVILSGDRVTIFDTHSLGNCGSQYRSSLTLSHDTLRWVRTDTVGPIARCICPHDFSISFKGLPGGRHIAEVYLELRKQYFYTVDTVEFIGSVTFETGAPSGQFTGEATFLGACANTNTIQEKLDLVPSTIGMRNYPNPFNPRTVISCQWPALSKVTLRVYDLLGREVETLIDAVKAAGVYNVDFDGSNLASGVYFCRLAVEPVMDGMSSATQNRYGSSIITTRMVLAR
jgi:hypothetical protein